LLMEVSMMVNGEMVKKKEEENIPLPMDPGMFNYPSNNIYYDASYINT